MASTQKINRVEIIPIDIPYKRPFRVSFGGVVPGDFVVLKILTDEDVEGIGSSTGFLPANGQTRESAMSIMKIYPGSFLPIKSLSSLVRK